MCPKLPPNGNNRTKKNKDVVSPRDRDRGRNWQRPIPMRITCLPGWQNFHGLTIEVVRKTQLQRVKQNTPKEKRMVGCSDA